MVTRAAFGSSNSRSTLMTGMPASIACSAIGVIAAPSNGSSTIASTPSLMNVSTWLIWTATSLVPSATRSSMSSYFAASRSADAVIEPIQPWSAAGAEKPMTTLSPASSFEPASAWVVPPPVSSSSLSPESLLVQAARASTETPATRVVPIFLLNGRRDFIVRLLGAVGWCVGWLVKRCAVASRGVAPRRQPLLQEHGGDDDGSLEEQLLGEGAVVEDEDVRERREDDDAEDGADDRAAATGEQGAADDDGRDRVELPAGAVGRAARR